MPKRKADHTDLHILNLLQREPNITMEQLCKRIGLAKTSTFERVKKLEAQGLISEVERHLNKPALGYESLYQLKLSSSLSDLQGWINDQFIEQVHELKVGSVLGAKQFLVVVRVKNEESLKEWCTALVSKYTQTQIAETHQLSEPLKRNSSLKLTYHDLGQLRKVWG
ncbi:MAG: Lrp/AsnC family transcriptional regulator [Bacteroidetes bacterium]|nr:Lrp/AsnC family transcriptional regulator [Bacteroidota bacterium]